MKDNSDLSWFKSLLSQQEKLTHLAVLERPGGLRLDRGSAHRSPKVTANFEREVYLLCEVRPA